jgi:hypothetical protein
VRLLRTLPAAVLLLLLGTAVVAVAADHLPPLSEAPTATALLDDDAALAEAMRDAYVGDRGIYDPAEGIVSPDEIAFDLDIRAAFDGQDIVFRYDFPTPEPAYHHDVVVYRDGEWIRAGSGPIGPEAHGLHEDRVAMLVDDGSVKGFANQGGWLTCHEDLPGIFAAADDEELEGHPVLGAVYEHDELGKYLPQARDAGPEWWRTNGWGAMSVENLDAYEQRHEAGVFLDLWHWRSHRSAPIGYSDNQYVFENRNSSPGTGPYTTNWDGDAGTPAFMFDPDAVGYAALDWATIQAGGYDWDGGYALISEVNAIPFDPDREWQDGDTIPRRLLRIPDGSRGAITSEATVVPDGDGWRWQVELRRAMDTGEPTADKVFEVGRTYTGAVAVHRLANGGRWHHVTLPFSIGIDMPADVTAVRFDGDRPDWDAIEPTTLTAIYPGQTTWEWITSDEHPGGSKVRADTMSVLGCHDDPIGLGAANRAIEPMLAGVDVHVEGPGVLASLVLEPTNAVFVFFLVAVGTILGAVIVGRRRRPIEVDEGDST